MCGISGVISLERNLGQAEYNKAHICSSHLIHRGKDGYGLYEDEFVSLHHRRLSIIDVDGGFQPIFNEDKKIILICNGEIYNYVELRKDLEKKGHVFKSNSDSETIVHAYEEYGLDFVDHLRGAFAFCLYDKYKKQVYLIRDRLGEKPLLIYRKGNLIFFSSEFRSLLEIVDSKTIDKNAIYEYLKYKWIPEPYTLLKEINKIMPGEICTLKHGIKSVKKRIYWNLKNFSEVPDNKFFSFEKLKKELITSTKIITRSDVKLGIALSGGLDSSLLAAMLSSHGNKKIKAYTVGYSENGIFDESIEAQKTAENLGLDFKKINISKEQVVKSLPKLCDNMDEPFGDISGFSYNEIMQHANRDGIKVMFLGQGGDELFYGYSWMREAYALNKSMKEGFIKTLMVLINIVLPKFHIHSLILFVMDGFGYRRMKYLLDKIRPFSQKQVAFLQLSKPFHKLENKIKKLIINKKTIKEYHFINRFYREEVSSYTGVQLIRLILKSYLVSNGINQVDRYSMSNSIETRLPLLDYRFMEEATKFWVSNKPSSIDHKYHLKKIAKDYLSEEKIERKKKGFTPPETWRTEVINTYKNDLINGLLVSSGVINRNELKKLFFKTRLSGSEKQLLYQLIVLELYFISNKKLVE